MKMYTWAQVATAAKPTPQTCASGGNAVYRARVIIGMINSGIHYDDIIICNSQGVYKNGNSKLQEQLNSLNDVIKRKELEEAGVMLYPNPATSSVDIQYVIDKNEEADLIFYDMLGNVVKTVKLFSNVTKKTLLIDDFARGLYIYQFNTNSGRRYVGKLIKE